MALPVGNHLLKRLATGLHFEFTRRTKRQLATAVHALELGLSQCHDVALAFPRATRRSDLCIINPPRAQAIGKKQFLVAGGLAVFDADFKPLAKELTHGVL